MRKNNKTCYTCEARATSDEHVPPKCLFPERKDLPSGIDLRKNLFKVPSCDVHNSQKSNDDEYLLYILSSSYQINDVGRNHYRTKTRRSIKRNASILGKIASSASPVTFEEPISGNDVNSIAHEMEPDRFNTMVDRMAHAIFFYHFKDKWLYKIRYQAEFLFTTVNLSDQSNERLKDITKQADEWFATAVYYGENPEVFKYQAIETENSKLMRLHFYEGCKLLLIFNNQQQL